MGVLSLLTALGQLSWAWNHLLQPLRGGADTMTFSPLPAQICGVPEMMKTVWGPLSPQFIPHGPLRISLSESPSREVIFNIPDGVTLVSW